MIKEEIKSINNTGSTSKNKIDCKFGVNSSVGTRYGNLQQDSASADKLLAFGAFMFVVADGHCPLGELASDITKQVFIR